MENRQSRAIESSATMAFTIPDSPFPIPLAAQRPTKKRHEGAYGMQCLGQYQVQAVVVLMSHARPAFPRATS